MDNRRGSAKGMSAWGRASGRRPKRQLGVSTVVATILLVAIAVVLAAILYVLVAGLVQGSGSAPLGGALAVGQPAMNTGSASTASAGYCTSGNTCFSLTIERASASLVVPDLAFKVTNGSGGPTYITAAASLGFSLVNISGKVLAHAGNVAKLGALITGSWTYSNGMSAGTSLNSTMVLWVDMGTTSPVGSSQFIVAMAVGGYSGTVSASL